MFGQNQFEEMKHQIDEVEIVSFDVFDTLVKRIVNTPEAIFELLGSIYDLYDFKTIRHEYQMRASEEVKRKFGRPHANIDEIYEYFENYDERNIDWQAVKHAEVQMEEDALVCNHKMFEIFEYAKEKGKRIIAVSDMYLFAETIENILEKCGYIGFDHIYVSANENATKYEGTLFEHVLREEGVAADKVLHIGDSYKDDYEHAIAIGLRAIQYKTQKMSDDLKYMENSPVDYGVSSLLIEEKGDYWYNFGVYVGGPLYLGLYSWMLSKIEQEKADKVYFLARDGYNLCQLMKKDGYEQAEYLYTSRRALLLAGVVELDDKTLSLLPPFTYYQTVGEVLEYLDINDIVTDSCIRIAGFSGRDSIISNDVDRENFKSIYKYSETKFLKKCETERNNAKHYFEKIGFFDGNNILFDCGWNGSSQYLLDRFLNAIGYEKECKFFYVGIMNTHKSRKQLQNKVYETYLFDYAENINMQQKVMHAVVIFELLFGAPHESVLMYGNDEPVLEKSGISQKFKEQIYQGISDFVSLARPFVQKYGIEISRENAIASLIRLVNHPTIEEAMVIGDVENVDGFANKKGEKKYIAKIDKEIYEKNPNIEIYWIEGLMTRTDIEKDLKEKIAADYNFDLKSFMGERSNKDVKESREGYLQKKYGNKVLSKTPYMVWIAENESNNYFTEKLEYNPKFSVVIPVYNVIDEQLIDCIESVKKQTYSNWELILVDDASPMESVRKVLSRYENQEKIHIIYRKENGRISKTTNDGIKVATGDFIAFSDCDDVLAPNALYEMAKKLNENPEYDFIYSDEDKLSEDGKERHNPFFKPDWSPDTFMSLMYTNHLAIYRTSKVRAVGGLNPEFDGSQDYDFTLRFLEKTDNSKVGHIPKVLYHWRERKESIASTIEAKPYALAAMKKAKENMLIRRKIKGHVEFVNDMYQYRIVYEPNGELVSIIVPSKDNTKILFQCINSIIKYTDYPNYEIVIVDNGSSEANRKKIEAFIKDKNITYHYQKMQFNFSRMCNIGRQIANGELLLFLNDDIEIFQPKWLSKLAGHALQEHTGAVGAKLLYPASSIIQHAGITNLTIGPSHILWGFDDSMSYYFGRNRVDYNYLAVTGACLMMTAQKFDEIGGFDENLSVAYNDVDLCYRLYEKGYYNVLRNDVMLYHHESVSRGSDDVSEEKQNRQWKEREILEEKHPNLRGKDPFYNINLTNNKINYEIKESDYDEEFCEFYPLNKIEGVKEQKFICFFDRIECGQYLKISGWYYTGTEYIDHNSSLYIVFRDDLGNLFEAATNEIFRPDVAIENDNETCLTGFECILPKNTLSIECSNYSIGCRLQVKEYRKSLFMWTDAYVGKECKIQRDLSGIKRMKKFEPIMSDEIVCTLDRIEEKNGLLKIRGWAFLKGESERNCQTSILLKDINGNIYKAETETEIRYDVAKEFVDKPWILNSGFNATIRECYLNSHEEYVIGVMIHDFSHNKGYVKWSDENIKI